MITKCEQTNVAINLSAL